MMTLPVVSQSFRQAEGSSCAGHSYPASVTNCANPDCSVCSNVNGRWCYLWRAIDQCGQLIDFRLTARRTANAARAFMRQATDNVRLLSSANSLTAPRGDFVSRPLKAIYRSWAMPMASKPLRKRACRALLWDRRSRADQTLIRANWKPWAYGWKRSLNAFLLCVMFVCALVGSRCVSLTLS